MVSPQRPARHRAFLLAYAVSGAAGLIYEVAWTRLLTLQTGHTVGAASTVLAAFMGGLAGGAFLGGRLAGRMPARRILVGYAVLELTVAVAAALLPVLLSLFDPLLSLAYADGTASWRFGAARLAVDLAVLLVPTLAMGATFPFATRWSGAAARPDCGAGVYAANTVGAALAAVAAGFVLLPDLGLRLTVYSGFALNVVAAAIALLIARLPEPVEGGPGRASERGAGGAARTRTAGDARPSLPLAAAASCLAGLAALALEVAWTRVLALVLGPTSYAFSAMLAAFLAGLGVGSSLGAWLAVRTARPGAWLAAALTAAAGAAAFDVAYAGRVPLLVAAAVTEPGAAFGSVIWREGVLTAVLLVPLACAFGAAFPLALALGARPGAEAARGASIVYASNAGGAILGSLAAGFFLIPTVGLRLTIVAAALALAAGAVVLAWRATTTVRSRAAAVAVPAAAAGLVLMTPAWNPSLMASGAYKYAPYLGGVDLETTLGAGELRYRAEGAAGTVTVRRVRGVLSLAIDGKVDASNGADMLTQSMLGHVPLLLHGAAREVCVIGLGSGVTVGAVLRHRVDRVDVLEISPEVVAAASLFDEDHHHALADSRTRVIVGDGRTHLRSGSLQYDVIIAEPSNPWISGMSALFTREFFEAARARLRPGGVVCQWTHAYDMSAADLRSIVATFAAVFPHGTLWLIGDEDVLLVGGLDSFGPRLARLAGDPFPPAVGADLAARGVREPFGLVSLLVGTERAWQAFAAGAEPQTDDRLALEYSGPLNIFGGSTNRNAAELRAAGARAGVPEEVAAVRQTAEAPAWRNLGEALLRAEAPAPAFDAFAQAVARDPRDGSALDGLARTAAAMGEPDRAMALLRAVCAQDPGNVQVRLAASRLLASAGSSEDAVRFAVEAAAIGTDQVVALEQLASVLADIPDVNRLERLVGDLEPVAAVRPDVSYYRAVVGYLHGDPSAAAVAAERAVRMDPGHARAWALLGSAHAAMSRTDEARRAFARALALDPRNAVTWANAGQLESRAGDLAAASSRFAEALTLDPTLPTALSGLAEVLERQGMTARAAALRARLRR